jgi:hypothetical protein
MERGRQASRQLSKQVKGSFKRNELRRIAKT